MRIEERVRQRTDQSKVITATEFRTFLEFLDVFDGFSIGSNDLTQLIL